MDWKKSSWAFSNPTNQWIAVHQVWIVAGTVALALAPLKWSLPTFLVLVALGLWLLVHSALTLFWLHRSRRLGLKNLMLRPVPAALMNHLGRGIGLHLAGPVAEVHTWTHMSYRRRGGIDRYQEDLLEDARTLAALVRSGRLKVRFVTCNTFNRYLLEFLEEAFSFCKANYFKGIALTSSALKLYRKRPFEKTQKRMFGRVYSARKVNSGDQWALLVVQVGEGELM